MSAVLAGIFFIVVLTLPGMRGESAGRDRL
jgi:hypothetical protein